MEWLEIILELVFDLWANGPWWNSNNQGKPEKSRTNEQLMFDRYCVTRRILDPHYVPEFKQKIDEQKAKEYVQYLDNLIDFAKKGNEAIPNEKYFNHVTYQEYFKQLNKLKEKFNLD